MISGRGLESMPFVNFIIGDTLFLGGCGRFFEGSPEQMNKSLNETLGGLPDDTVRLLYPVLVCAYLQCGNRGDP